MKTKRRSKSKSRQKSDSRERVNKNKEVLEETIRNAHRSRRKRSKSRETVIEKEVEPSSVRPRSEIVRQRNDVSTNRKQVYLLEQDRIQQKISAINDLLKEYS